MKLLLDTHVLLWAAGNSPRLSTAAKELIEDDRNSLIFSAASIWEVVIKHMLGREDFRADPAKLRKSLLANGYTEWPVTSAHALAVGQLPDHHKIRSTVYSLLKPSWREQPWSPPTERSPATRHLPSWFEAEWMPVRSCGHPPTCHNVVAAILSSETRSTLPSWLWRGPSRDHSDGPLRVREMQ